MIKDSDLINALGKRTASEISAIKQDLSYLSESIYGETMYTGLAYGIDGAGKWVNNGDSSWIVPVKGGDKVFFRRQNERGVFYAFLKSNKVEVSKVADFATGYTNRTYASDLYTELVAPSDAKWFWCIDMSGGTTPYRPKQISINGKSVLDSLLENMVSKLNSGGDGVDVTYLVNALFKVNSHVILGEGDFYLNGVVVPVGGTLSGQGDKTRLIFTGSNNNMVTLSNKATIRDLSIFGGYESRPTTNTGKNGIYINGDVDNTRIENVTVIGCGGSGIHITNTTGSTKPVMLDNVYVTGCRTGLYIDHHSEFVKASNSVFRDCFTGVENEGGNNNFSNCGIDHNAFGIYTDARNLEGDNNNSHNSYVGCSLNHNDVTCQLWTVPNGIIFSACQIHFAEIRMNDCKGVTFVGCEFGRVVNIISGSNGYNYFMNNVHFGDPNFQKVDTSNRFPIVTNSYNFNTGATITTP